MTGEAGAQGTATAVIDQGALDDMRQVAGWAVLNATAVPDGEAMPAGLAALVALSRALGPVGYPQCPARPFGPSERDVALLRAEAERMISHHSPHLTWEPSAETPRTRAIRAWARDRVEVGKRTLLHLGGPHTPT